MQALLLVSPQLLGLCLSSWKSPLNQGGARTTPGPYFCLDPNEEIFGFSRSRVSSVASLLELLGMPSNDSNGCVLAGIASSTWRVKCMNVNTKRTRGSQGRYRRPGPSVLCLGWTCFHYSKLFTPSTHTHTAPVRYPPQPYT